MVDTYFEAPMGEVEVVGLRSDKHWQEVQSRFDRLGLNLNMFCGQQGPVCNIRALAPYASGEIAVPPESERLLASAWPRKVDQVWNLVDEFRARLREGTRIDCDIRLATPFPDFVELPAFPGHNWFGRHQYPMWDSRRGEQKWVSEHQPGRYYSLDRLSLKRPGNQVVSMASQAMVACCFDD